jgi:hypothetical protein
MRYIVKVKKKVFLEFKRILHKVRKNVWLAQKLFIEIKYSHIITKELCNMSKICSHITMQYTAFGQWGLVLYGWGQSCKHIWHEHRFIYVVISMCLMISVL